MTCDLFLSVEVVRFLLKFLSTCDLFPSLEVVANIFPK